jgi:hypothetical protein
MSAITPTVATATATPRHALKDDSLGLDAPDFSSDRTVRQYAEEIWGVAPVRVAPAVE